MNNQFNRGKTLKVVIDFPLVDSWLFIHLASSSIMQLFVFLLINFDVCLKNKNIHS